MSHAPRYGLISNQHTTNGDWYDALNYALTELDPAYEKDPGHGGIFVVDRAGVPQELLSAADGWCVAPEEDRRLRFENAKAYICKRLRIETERGIREEVIKLFPGEEVSAAEDGCIRVGTASRIYVRYWSEPLLYSVQLNSIPPGGHRTLLAAAIAAYRQEQVERAADVASKERMLERSKAACAWVSSRLDALEKGGI
jgi:hypothetical protein